MLILVIRAYPFKLNTLAVALFVRRSVLFSRISHQITGGSCSRTKQKKCQFFLIFLFNFVQHSGAAILLPFFTLFSILFCNFCTFPHHYLLKPSPKKLSV